jgi:hypothetical protein
VKEAVFSTEVIKSVQALGHFAFKIPDMPRGPLTRFIPSKPYDLQITCKGRSVAVECMQFNIWKPLTLDTFQPSQIQNLTKHINIGEAYSFIFLNIRIPREKSRLYIFEWAELYKRLKMGPMSQDEIEMLYESLTAHKNLFDLRSFFKDYVLK